jgi:lipopolysaccharide export system protein LptC
MKSAMHKRTAHRWRLGASLIAGTVFALGSFWLVQVINRGSFSSGVEAPKTEPDYIVENFSFVRMTPDGKPRYIVSGDKLTHRPEGDISDVDKPVVLNLSPAEQPMTMNAERGRIDHAKNVVDLMGRVDIQRAASPKTKRMTIKTEQLTVFPDEDRMTSSQAVVMTLGDSRIQGVGMQADNAAQTVHFSKSGQIMFPPKPR